MSDKDVKKDFDQEINENILKQNTERIINTKLLKNSLRSNNKFKEDLDYEKNNANKNIFSLVYKDNKAKNSIPIVNVKATKELEHNKKKTKESNKNTASSLNSKSSSSIDENDISVDIEAKNTSQNTSPAPIQNSEERK